MLVAFATARWVSARAALLPLAIAAGAVPIIAIAPLMNNWFGVLSPLSKMMMAAVLVFFPVMVNVTRGLVQVDPAALELMRSYAASESAVLRKVRIPNALPYFFTALKLGATLSLIGAIVAEYFGGSSLVLGRIIVQSASALRFDITWAAILLGATDRDRRLPRRSRRSSGRHPVARAPVRPADRRRLDRTRYAFRRSRSPRPPGWRRPREGFKGDHVVRVKSRPRPRGGAGDRAGRLHERRHAIAVGLRAGRVRTGLGPSRVGARVGSGVGIDRRTGNRPAPAPVGPAGPVRRLLRGRPAGLLRGREPDRPDGAGRRRRDPAGRRFAAGRPGVHDQLGAEGPSRPARPARISSTSPRSSSGPGRCRCRGRTTRSTDPCKFAGKKVGVWDFGNEFEVTAGALACGLTPGLENNGDPSKQYQKVIQPFDMTLLLSRQIDVAEAMIYNEYAQVLEAQNPETGQLYKPEDLNIINWNDYRVAMLQDAVFARKAWLDTGSNRDIAVRFVRASLKGWIYCRDHPDDCVKYTTDAGSQLGAGHQAWMMNEVNALVWPSPLGVGVLDPVFYGQTVRIAKNAGVIKNDPSPDAYDASIAKEALQAITDGDTKGADFKKATLPGHARRQLSPCSSTRRSEHGPARKGRPVSLRGVGCPAPSNNVISWHARYDARPRGEYPPRDNDRSAHRAGLRPHRDIDLHHRSWPRAGASAPSAVERPA